MKTPLQLVPLPSLGLLPVILRSQPLKSHFSTDHFPKNCRFVTEWGQCGKKEWDAILAGFHDANLFQTWSYAAARWGYKKLSHLVLKDGRTVVGAAQTILVKLPVLRGGFAYVQWGPMWRARNREANAQVFRELLRALRRVYAHERGFMLRLAPWEFVDVELQPVPNEEGYRRTPRFHQRTAVLDLKYSLTELRMSLTKHWRYDLTRAESNNLDVVYGASDDLHDEFAELYGQMRALKRDAWIPLVPYLHQVQGMLPLGMKAHTSICRHRGKAIAGLIVSALGEKAFMWLAATGALGRELRGSYLLQWHMVQKLKSQGVSIYDLGGINEVTHPGTTHFKLGLSGRLGKTLDYLGEFEACEAWPSRLLIGAADQLSLSLIRSHKFWQRLRRAR